MSVPLRLDCTSRESTEQSLLAAFGCSVDNLWKFVRDPAHAAHSEEHGLHHLEFEPWFFKRACETLGMPRLPTELCLFHGTRVPEGTTCRRNLAARSFAAKASECHARDS